MSEANRSGAPDAEEGPKLSERLANSHVALRADLQIYRHLFRGEPAYVVRDPMTMQSHRFDLHDYEILIRIQPEQSLGDIFTSLVAEERLGPDEEEAFYRFVVDLHQLAFLNLPVPNERTLYKRHLYKQRAKRAQQLKGILFLRIPLFNPDAFLDRTQGWVRPLFSRPFLVAWLGMLVLCAAVAANNAQELLRPAHGVLAASNLPFMWVALVGLKLAHEFGHAYACRIRGGEVPEMGAFLVVFTPLAYVDASSAWSFARRWDRLVVSLAGVYVESIFAMAALLVWVSSESSLARMLAHNVILLASVVTLVANANPLMRFDGYYVLSDLLEMPNLRARAEQRLRAAAKRLAFGIQPPEDGTGRGMHAFLVGFGLAAAVYKVVLVLSISLLIAGKAFLLGMLIAVGYAGSQLVNAVRGLAQYLLRSEETLPHRRRAVGLAVSLLLLLPLALLVVPVPSSVRASGEVRREFEETVVATQPGFVKQIGARTGDRVEAGAVLASLENRELSDGFMESQAGYELARLRARGLESRDPARALGAWRQADARRAELERRRAELAALELPAERGGVVVRGLEASDVRRFVRAGESIATVASGAWWVRALLNADELAAARPRIGQEVALRFSALPGRTFHGEVTRVAPAGSRSVSLESLTHLAGGDIPVDADSLEADQPYFELVVELAEPDPRLRQGMIGYLRLDAAAEPLAVSGARRLMRIFNRVARD